MGQIIDHHLDKTKERLQLQNVSAILGKDSRFTGTLSFEGTVRIDGKFQGEIFTEHSIIIAEGAIVEANIQATYVIISGNFKGQVKAYSIEIHNPAKVIGDLHAQYLRLEEGVFFEGTSNIVGFNESPVEN